MAAKQDKIGLSLPGNDRQRGWLRPWKRHVSKVAARPTRSNRKRMAFEKCKRCGFMHYSTDPCKESTAVGMGRLGQHEAKRGLTGVSQNGEVQRGEGETTPP